MRFLLASGPVIVLDWGNIAAMATVFATVGSLVAWLHPKMKKLMNMLDDWSGESERPGVPQRDGVMVRLEKIERRLDDGCTHSTAMNRQTEMLTEILKRLDNSDEDAH